MFAHFLIDCNGNYGGRDIIHSRQKDRIYRKLDVFLDNLKKHMMKNYDTEHQWQNVMQSLNACSKGGRQNKLLGDMYPIRGGGGVDPPPPKKFDFFKTKCKKISTSP